MAESSVLNQDVDLDAEASKGSKLSFEEEVISSEDGEVANDIDINDLDDFLNKDESGSDGDTSMGSIADDSNTSIEEAEPGFDSNGTSHDIANEIESSGSAGDAFASDSADQSDEDITLSSGELDSVLEDAAEEDTAAVDMVGG